MNFTVLDVILIVIIIIFTIRAGLRGFVMEAGAFASCVLAFLFALSFYGAGAVFIRARVFAEVKVLPEVISFFALFMVIFIPVKILGGMVNDIIERLNLGWLNRVLGAAFGFLEGLAASSFIIFLISRQPLFDGKALLDGSFFASFLGLVVEQAVSWTSGAIKRRD
ncbi:MAG: CvpA family protein [Spirochaetaceae bacterium]|nr:CvpA family protein [Spirochaetaceae bacterium]